VNDMLGSKLSPGIQTLILVLVCLHLLAFVVYLFLLVRNYLAKREPSFKEKVEKKLNKKLE